MKAPAEVAPPDKPNKTYLGDGVYVALDDNSIYLTTENGISVIDQIWLDHEVFLKLMDFADKVGYGRK